MEGLAVLGGLEGLEGLEGFRRFRWGKVIVTLKAADPLAGGILQLGRQCGMLWGAALAVGAEAYRRCEDPDKAVGLAVKSTQSLIESFTERTNTVDCRDITGTDFNKPLQMLRYMLFRAKGCFNLAEDWMPEAISAAEKGLSFDLDNLPEQPLSCASEAVRRMGGSEEEVAMVAGLAGGMGLSGHGCGALGAAIWVNSLAWVRENPDKSPYKNPAARKTLAAFQEATGGELRCSEICGRRFETLEEHTAFIKKGGCGKLLEVLTASGPRRILELFNRSKGVTSRKGLSEHGFRGASGNGPRSFH